MKVGKFYVPATYASVTSSGWKYSDMARVTNGLAILRAESVMHRGDIEYIAVGEPFDDIADGTEPPLYHVIVEQRIGQPNRITFKRST